MKQTIKSTAILALLAVCFAARADWAEIERFDDETRVYVDRDTARRNGNVAEVLHLVRWGEPQADPGQPVYLSTVVRTAYDCASKLEKYLASTSYAGAMGNGAKVTSDNDEAETWYSISDGSMEEKLWRVACGAN